VFSILRPRGQDDLLAQLFGGDPAVLRELSGRLSRDLLAAEAQPAHDVERIGRCEAHLGDEARGLKLAQMRRELDDVELEDGLELGEGRRAEPPQRRQHTVLVHELLTVRDEHVERRLGLPGESLPESGELGVEGEGLHPPGAHADRAGLGAHQAVAAHAHGEGLDGVDVGLPAPDHAPP
jgi:hypothetical protein